MKKIIHKLSFYHKKIGLTMVLVVLMGWFVYAGNGGRDFGERETKIVKFYPNPATSLINFEFPNDIDKNYVLQVYSFTGKKMTEMPVSANKITVTLNNDFYRGIYIFRLSERSGKVVETGKFQVVK